MVGLWNETDLFFWLQHLKSVSKKKVIRSGTSETFIGTRHQWSVLILRLEHGENGYFLLFRNTSGSLIHTKMSCKIMTSFLLVTSVLFLILGLNTLGTVPCLDMARFYTWKYNLILSFLGDFSSVRELVEKSEIWERCEYRICRGARWYSSVYSSEN